MFAAALCVVAAGCNRSESAALTTTARLELSIHFAALWWSLDQMENLDPDNPPAKRTEVELQRWESGDPVGQPNPDTFDVVATFAHVSGQPPLYLALQQRWSTGPIDSAAVTRWTPWQPVSRHGPLRVYDKTPSTVRLATIDLATQQARLFAEDRWPWAYEARVSLISDDPTAPPLASATRNLPILPAD